MTSGAKINRMCIKQFVGKNPNKLYRETLRQIMRYGELTSPRGLETKEISPVITVIEKPDERLLSCFGRGGNIFFLVAETIWILGGRGDIAFMDYYIQNLKQFADVWTEYTPNTTSEDAKGYYPDYNGAYGIRMRKYGQDRTRTSILEGGAVIDQLLCAVTKLTKEPATRQAVINLWNPYIDNIYTSKDYPCNNISYPKVRKGKLNWTQIIRSNDVNLGLYPTNVFQWTMIMKVVADSLGVKMGEIRFWSDSLHAYLDNKIIQDVLKYQPNTGEWDFDIYDYVSPQTDGLSLNVLDKHLQAFFEIEKQWKKGDFSFSFETCGKFWNSMFRIIKIFSMKKFPDKHIQMLDEVKKIEAQDFRILVYEYLFRNSKDHEYLEILKSDIAQYPKMVKDFIIHGKK